VDTSVKLGGVVEAVVSAARWRYPDITISVVDAGAGLVGKVNGGEDSLVRVLTNLVVNACEGDGTRGATCVTVKTRRGQEQGTVVVAVEDDGPGFPPERLKRIEGFSTTKAEGTGLGLYTCERLLWAGGGQLLRANRPSGGALVEVVLLDASGSPEYARTGES